MKRLQGFICGFLAAVIVLLCVPSLAANIEATFNSLAISYNGVKVVDKGQNYMLPNGNEVPFSILYKGTTYLPMRKLSEIIGMDVSYDGEKGEINVTDAVAEPINIVNSPEEKPIGYKEKPRWATIGEIATFLVKSFDLSDRGGRYIFRHTPENDSHYIDVCTIKDFGFYVGPEPSIRKEILYCEICENMLEIDLSDPQFDPDPNVVKDIDRVSAKMQRGVMAAVKYGFAELLPDGTFGRDMVRLPLEPRDYVKIMEDNGLEFKVK